MIIKKPEGRTDYKILATADEAKCKLVGVNVHRIPSD